MSPSTNQMPKGHNSILILAFYSNIASNKDINKPSILKGWSPQQVPYNKDLDLVVVTRVL